ncbi:MAG: phage holin family protein [Oscillospiraceae bacterium]
MDLMNYIQAEGLIIIPFLYVLGEMIKGVKKIPDKYIPIILLVFGVGSALALLGTTPASIIQGVLLTGATVYSNQVVKQINK